MTASFSIAHACILVASLLPIVCAGIAKWGAIGKPRRDGGYDNDDPRAWLAGQSQWRARANAEPGAARRWWTTPRVAEGR